LSRWKLDGDTVLLRSMGRGQEFVLDCQNYPDAIQWLSQLLLLEGTGKQIYLEKDPLTNG
jgi:hypothetical protein